MAKNLRIAVVALIVYGVLFLPFTILTFAKMAADGAFGDDATFSMPSLLIVLFHVQLVVFVVVNILWIRGFLLIGKHLKNRLLVVSSYFLIIAVSMFAVLEWIPLSFPFDIIAFVVAILINGIALIPFGIGTLPLQKKFGGIATAYGVMLIAQGSCLVLIIPSFLQMFMEIPTCVLGVIVLLKAVRLFPSNDQ